MMAAACSCPHKKIANGLLMHHSFFIVLQIAKGLKKMDDVLCQMKVASVRMLTRDGGGGEGGHCTSDSNTGSQTCRTM